MTAAATAAPSVAPASRKASSPGRDRAAGGLEEQEQEQCFFSCGEVGAGLTSVPRFCRENEEEADCRKRCAKGCKICAGTDAGSAKEILPSGGQQVLYKFYNIIFNFRQVLVFKCHTYILTHSYTHTQLHIYTLTNLLKIMTHLLTHLHTYTLTYL